MDRSTPSAWRPQPTASRHWTLGLLCAAVLSACGGGSSPDDATPAPKPETWHVSTALDASFAEQGRFPLAVGAHGTQVAHVSELADDKLLLVLNVAGSPLPESAMAPEPDPNDWVLASLRHSLTQSPPSHLQVLRLLPNGTPDPSFGEQGSIAIRLLGAEKLSEVTALPSGKIWLSIASTEPCVDVDQPSASDPVGAWRVCTVDAGTPHPRPARQTSAQAFITPAGQLDPSSVDLSRLSMEDAGHFLTLRAQPYATSVQFNHRQVAGERLWFSQGHSYVLGQIFNWQVKRRLPDAPSGNRLVQDTAFSFQSACATSDAGKFDVDTAGTLWTASSQTSSSSSAQGRSICLERADHQGQPLWARPLEVALPVSRVLAQTMTVFNGVGHVAAWSLENEGYALHTLQVSEQGELRTDYGTQGIANTPLPAEPTWVSHEADGSAWVHSRDPETGQNHLQHLDAQGKLNHALGTNGTLALDGEAATASLQFVDRQRRWLMVSGDASQGTLALIRVQGNAQP